MQQLGRYQLIEEISRETTGTVYKARDPLLDRLLTIKTIELPDACSGGQLDTTCLEREARFLARLNHPNIVTVHDAGRIHDVAYVAMEFLEGRTLREILDSRLVLAPAKIARIAAQAADGLSFMHEHGTVHRNMSPSSIVVLDNGHVKIAHFEGTFLASGSRTPIHEILPSRVYAPPERAKGARADARSDIFSLGAVLYEMLTGVAPFMGTDQVEALDELINKKQIPPSQRNPDIPSAFDYVVAKALAKDPVHRYRNAREMASDIRKLALEEPTFSPMPARSVANQYLTRLESRDDSSALRTSADLPEVAASARHQGDPDDLLRHRRLVLYGVPAALLIVAGELTLLSRRNSLPEPTPGTAVPAPDTKASVTLEPPASAAPETPRGETAAGALSPSAARPASASAERDERLPAAIRMARVSFAVSPWGEIYVDGRKKGVCPPLTQLRLTPGKHTVEIRNMQFPPRRQSIEVAPQARLKIKHKFV